MDSTRAKFSISTGMSKKPAIVEIHCPQCARQGRKVGRETVASLVREELTARVGEGPWYLCMSDACDLAYYSGGGSRHYSQGDISVPLWFKKGASPRYACYCNKVTEAQVIQAVRESGARTVEEVNGITGAMKDSDCTHNNPLGRCCHGIIQEAIAKALAMSTGDASEALSG